jgi:hypothetical protein
VAFACAQAVGCIDGCKTVLDPHGDYEGVHVCFTACEYPGCIPTFGRVPRVETLVQNASDGDIKAAVGLVTKYPRSVRYNADRHALVYYSACTGEVPIGVQPLSIGQTQAVEAALAG